MKNTKIKSRQLLKLYAAQLIFKILSPTALPKSRQTWTESSPLSKMNWQPLMQFNLKWLRHKIRTGSSSKSNWPSINRISTFWATATNFYSPTSDKFLILIPSRLRFQLFLLPWKAIVQLFSHFSSTFKTPFRCCLMEICRCRLFLWSHCLRSWISSVSGKCQRVI